MQSDSSLTSIQSKLNACLIKHRHGFVRQLQTIRKRQAENKPVEKSIDKLQQQLSESLALVAQRQTATPNIQYDDDLPVSARREDIANAIAQHQVVVIAGETGSGKTTQIPKICMELGLASRGLIAHTQPRRLAARSVAQRIADEVQVPLGEQIGYQIRFTDQSTDQTLVKLMTDGILLAETQHDRFLNRYQTIIIDEAHERSLNIDFLLGYLKQLLPKRPDLKVIITSATIDVDRFANHFADAQGKPAPVIEVSGRTYPVEVRYRPLLEDDDDEKEADLYQGIVNAVDELIAEDHARGQIGDVLVFLSGEREIREASLALKRALTEQKAANHTEILPLYARLSGSEQNKIFNPTGGKRRIILATNVAETSLTVPGIRYVIDSGLARISRYSYRSKVQRLPIEPISQASANQRKGRCGRVSEGVCIRLYGEDDFNLRPEFTDPEIRRTNLAAVILQMLSLRLGDITHFPFVDAPDSRFVKDGYNLLKELGAVNSKQTITPVGHKLSRLPVDPRVARMLIEAHDKKALTEMLVIAAALSIQDPRERPADRQQAADQKHAEFRHDESDFLTLLNLWARFEEERQALSNNQLKQFCKKQFLSYMRMREWRDVHHQLRLLCKELQLSENKEPASYAALHQAILAGMLSHIGNKDEDGDYKGARNRKFWLFPGSGIFKKKPKWVVSAELVETTKLYARMNAKIEPEWLEPLAKDLVKRKYLEPHWSAKRGQVMAYEQVTLFGLVVVPKRRVGYGNIDEQVSHELFIREGLVGQQIQTKGDFLRFNQALIEEVSELEDKSRRRDIIVDDESLYQFYSERIPTHIYSTASFEKWRKDTEQKQPHVLKLTREYLMQHNASDVTEAQFPDHFSFAGVVYPLTYRFEPGHAEDGVSITVPAMMLKQLPLNRLQWLVPGMLKDKVVAVVKSLPKAIRKQLVPVPDFVDGFLANHHASDTALTDALAQYAYQQKRLKIETQDWQWSQVDDHYLMNIKVVGDDECVLQQGRDWFALVEAIGDQAQASVGFSDNEFERSDVTQWDFNELPEQMELAQAGIKVTLYPALVDEGSTVALKLVERLDAAHVQSQAGVLKLLQLDLTDQVSWIQKQAQAKLAQEIVYYGAIGNKTELLSGIVKQCFQNAFRFETLPRTRQAYDALREQGRGEIGEQLDLLIPVLKDTLKSLHELHKKMKKQNQLAFAFAVSDIRSQIAELMPKGFIGVVPFEWLKHYPRYIKAMLLRLDKLQGNLQKDKQQQQKVTVWQEAYVQLLSKLPADVGCYPEVLTLNWMMQEYRVSLFAQDLGTVIPVSDKRWQQQYQVALESVQQ